MGGISATHETSACLIKDGEILSAVSEERISRKNGLLLPNEDGNKSALKASKIEAEEIDAVAIAGLNWHDLLRQSFVRSKIFSNTTVG